jgi:ribA/ribD-fused uncharacterized protein
MKSQTNKNEERIYTYSSSCTFRKTKENFGGLSNMASGFPIEINGIHIYSSEALYQACRFPHLPEVQQTILEQKSPMTAKMVSKPFREESRKDWMQIRIKVMRWCLKVKLAQHFDSFGRLIESTNSRDIVEESSKDPFWGAIRINEMEMKGVNALGRLLMELRNDYNSDKRFDLLIVPPPAIPRFNLMGKKIKKIDERKKYIKGLKQKMGLEKDKISLPTKSKEKYIVSEPAKSSELLLF